LRKRDKAGSAAETAAPVAPRSLIIACGALAREILAVIELNRFSNIELTCLPALLHNRPEKIPEAVREAIRSARPSYDRIFVAYADCGTGGLLDKVLAEEGVTRLPGAHCYAFYSGVEAFAGRAEADMRAFFLTDFLVRQFDTLVIEGLGLDRHPELRDAYFSNYEKVVYLTQTEDSGLLNEARRAADRLGLAFEHRFVGLGDLAPAIAGFARAAAAAQPAGAAL
jgi:hypothetical protein